MNIHADLRRAALYLSVVQFFFFTTWVVYVTYLGDLLERVGIGRSALPWIILLDQILFALSDTAMGYAADLVERTLGRLSRWILAVNTLSCLAFILIPWGPGVVSPGLFLALILLWVATSSVLRAPPIVLLMKHAARPRVPWLAAASLLGLALGGAVSPYLGLWLKGIDPALPFAITGLTLFATTLGLTWMQSLKERLPPGERAPTQRQPGPKPWILVLLAASLLIGFGFQIHSFINSQKLYQAFIPKEQLPLFLPLFWIGFKLLVFPGAAAANRYGPLKVLSLAALIGSLGVALSSTAPSLELLIGGQMLAGGAWGVFFMAGISAALGLGTSGREGLVLGLWFSFLSLATLARAGIVVAGLDKLPSFAPWLTWIPPLAWLSGAVLLLLVLLGHMKNQQTESA